MSLIAKLKENKTAFSMGLKLKDAQLHPSDIKLDADEKKIYEDLLRDGVVAIPGFYTDEECEQMIADYEAVDEKYAKYYDNDRRIFGMEKHSKAVKKYHHDNVLAKNIAEAYLGDEVVIQTTMIGKIVPDDNVVEGSGGCWHRDSFSRQFKAVAYLSDVDITNGPFQYIKGSHKLEEIQKVLFNLDNGKKANDPRYSDDDIEKILKMCNQEITRFVAPKGTLVLADIRGLHTGMRIEEGHRYAIFNYYIAKKSWQGDSNIDKLANEY
jgi:hypothetical protein